MGETATSKTNDHQTIKENLKKFMETQVQTLRPPTTNPSIYKVPKDLRDGRAKLFEPISIPIGPLHYDSNSPAQEFKKWYLKNFIGRLNGVDKLAEVMSSLEMQFRECYRDINPNMKGDELVQIMLLDGCFVMELLWSHKDYSLGSFVGKTEKVPLLTLQQDLLKIENQLPFLVLETLADLAAETSQINKGNSNPDVIELSLKFFNISNPQNFTPGDRPRHLLELIMNALFQPSFPHKSSIIVTDDDDDCLTHAKSASELESYGVKFRATGGGGDSESLTKLEFNNGKLIIPPLVVQESTAALLWNFLIFEMSSCKSRIFTSYVVLMDSLIDREKDVEVLLREKILISRKNDIGGLVSLFNDMSANVGRKEFYFEALVREVNRYCGSSYHPVRAYLVRNYYDVRWSVLSNILLFILTVTQTLFSIPGLKKGD